jgi:hypothetical protein
MEMGLTLKTGTAWMRLFVVTAVLVPFVYAIGQTSVQPGVVDASGGRSSASSYLIHSSVGQVLGGSSSTSSGLSVRSGFIHSLNTSSSLDESPKDFFVTGLSLETSEEQAIQVELKGSDRLVFQVATPPLNGRLSGTPPILVYQPDPNFFGDDFFTFKGVRGERETDEAVMTISVSGVNDPPMINVRTELSGSPEDNDTLIGYEDLISASGAKDVEGLDISFVVESIKTGKLQTADFEPVVEGETLIGKRHKGLIWSPPANLNGQVEAFSIRASDGELFSDQSQLIVTVGAVPDPPVVFQPIADMEVDEGSGPFVIDLAEVFFDADSDSQTYIIKEVEKEYLVNAEIIDTSNLQLTLVEDMNGQTTVTIGFESNADIVYDTFKITIKSVFDENPHPVRDYWKGLSEDFGDIAMEPPLAYWSFESIEAIEKTTMANWRFDSESEPARKILESPNAGISTKDWYKVFFSAAGSVRVQSTRFLELSPDITIGGSKPREALEQYTLVFDIRTKYGQPNPLLNTLNPESRERSEVWLSPTGAVGGQREYSPVGSLKPGLWYRVIYIVDLAQGLRKYYVDFDNMLNQLVPEDKKERHKMSQHGFRVGFDELVTNQNYELKKIVLYDYPFSEEQAQFIGFNGYEELGEQQSKGDESEAIVSLIGPSSDDEWESKPGIIIYSSNPTSTSWIIQQSRDLITWEQTGQIEAEAADETGGVGFLEIETLFDDASMFYRAKAIE